MACEAAYATVRSPKGNVKKNDLKFFLTNGFKVDIIYIQKQKNNNY